MSDINSMFYETVEDKEINVAYAGDRIAELHSMAQGLLGLCRTSLGDGLFSNEGRGAVWYSPPPLKK